MPRVISFIDAMESAGFKDLIAASRSRNDFFNRVQRRKSGASVAILNRRIARENLDTSHFKLRGFMEKRIPLTQIIVQNSNYQGGLLKTRLVKGGYFVDQCNICGLGNEWNGKPIVLHLDHINGDRFDNRVTNLQILCPNCHSQTETWCGKAKQYKPRSNCTGCGTPVKTLGKTKCQSCARKFQKPRYNRPSKEELLELMKTLKVKEIKVRYGCKSKNTVRAWCKIYGIPTKRELI